LLGGLLTDTFAGINKIGATPTWCLWCAALACLVWVLLYLLIDVAGLRRWSILIRPAGANPLVAYFLHPIVLALVSCIGLEKTLLAYKASADPGVVMAGSLGMATFICLATGLLGRLGLRMRL
jgi:heparan-alpha-glucosaminide N-acetyltransferase